MTYTQGSVGAGNFRMDITSFSVLLLDDDEEWIGATRQYLESKGIDDIDVAQNTSEATQKIRSKAYDAVLADVDLQTAQVIGQASEQGDEWLVRHAEEIKASVKAAVTAYPRKIRNPRALEEKGIEVATKSDPSEFSLYDKIGVMAGARLGKQGPAEEEAVILGAKARESLSGAAADVFVEWLKSRRDPGSKSIWIGGQAVSLDDIAQGISEGSSLGQRVLVMFANHLRLTFRIGRSPFDE